MDGQGATRPNESFQGECEIAGTILPVLFDTGATHSFISMDYVERLKLSTSPLPFDLMVTTTADKIVTVDTACMLCAITILDKKFLVNLICLPLKNLVVILGMDWLSYHYIMLDCGRKLVIFPDSGLAKFLTAYHVKVSLKDGNQEYTALASVEVTNWNAVEDIPIVKEFVDVFPSDVPELPPIRETEFSIDLHPGTGPISIAPYRMSPSELSELKG
ncbi:uncharacterized protein [Medicago truncatula]|uniref:uncharacterized protein n=1 Tax=Medicago truncatula TaxID=3880 RepID=UPI000D2F1A32|nr:uncharacterized protein LOC112420811 [Medicago truncatula]